MASALNNVTDFFKMDMSDVASPSPTPDSHSLQAPSGQESVQIELKPPIDSLQPFELFKRVDHIIVEIREATDDNKKTELKAELMEALEQLKFVRLALANLQKLNRKKLNESEIPSNQNADYEMKTEESKEDLYYVNPITKYPNLRVAQNVLREQSFFAEHVSYFAMLLIEMNNFRSLKQEFTNTERDFFYKQIITTIDYGLPHQHMLFAHGERIIAMVSVDDDSELMQVGQEIINLISDKNFEVYNKMASTTLSIGAASLQTEMKDTNKSFDFKLWLKKCEAGLNAAKELNIKNNTNESRCCIGKGNDTSKISAISTVNSDSASVKKHESSFSLLASAAQGDGDASSQSNNSQHSGGLSSVMDPLNGEKPNYNSALNPTQLHSSLRLYDKLQRMELTSVTPIVTLSITNRFVKQGANFNFQNPRAKRNTLLMLCCIKNFDILIKFICTKIGSNNMDFDIQNDDGYTALMFAAIHVTDDKTVAMIAQNTKNKNALTNGGKSAKDIATENNRTSILDIL